MTNDIRFGIAGCGMVAEYHEKALSAAGGAVLVGACSKTPAHARDFAERHGVRFFESFEAMLASDEIDAVAVCTPSGEHFAMAMQALKAGKHVVIEKPMCLSLRDADTLIEEADKSGLTVSVISQSRFSDAAQAILAAKESGAFGKMVSASLTMRFFRSQEYYESAGWRGTVAGDGGGVLMNQGIHGVDLLCRVMGRPVSVCGYARTALRDIEVEDTAVGAVKFDDGSVAVIDATVCSQPSFHKRFVFCGEKGTVVLEEDAVTLWTLDTPCPVPPGNASGDSGSANPGGIGSEYHTRQYRNIIDHMNGGGCVEVDARQGRIPLSVILGLYEASAQEKVLHL